MADNDKISPQTRKKMAEAEQKIDSLNDRSSVMLYGSTGSLEQEADQIRNIVRQTVNLTNARYGERTNGKTITYFNEINFSKAFETFSDSIKDPAKKKKFEQDPEKAFKDFMEGENGGTAEVMLAGENDRILRYQNYRAIYDYIPECAQALDLYKHNIISADDFTKTIFNLRYDDASDADLQKKVEEQLEKLSEKYEFEDIADEIISNTLRDGDCYVACLSIEKELGWMLDDPVMQGNKSNLNEETIRLLDENVLAVELEKDDIKTPGVNLTEAFDGFYKVNESSEEKPTETELEEVIADLVNTHVRIGSKKEMLLERYQADVDLNEGFSVSDFLNGKTKAGKKSKEDKKPMYINGSSIKVLDPSRVVKLEIDNICYGYYVFEEDPINADQNAYGPSAGRETGEHSAMNMSTIYSPSTNRSRITPDIGKFTTLGVGEAKMELITKVFINALSKKLNKDFVRKNKEFKDLIYRIVKQDYILKKGLKITFLNPDEVVSFKVPAVYRKITFFAKLYLSTLTNNLLVNLGRSHDKRVYYVDVGLDDNYSQSINRVIQDIKTKEFKMSDIQDINTVLNLAPGKFDDYYIPTMNGQKPIEIDTIMGMNADLNNEFLEFLRKSMLSGTGVTMAMIDSTQDLEFSRQISSIKDLHKSNLMENNTVICWKTFRASIPQCNRNTA